MDKHFISSKANDVIQDLINHIMSTIIKYQQKHQKQNTRYCLNLMSQLVIKNVQMPHEKNMKTYKQPTELEFIHQFQFPLNNEQYSHSPSYQRIKQQVNSLIFEPPDNFCVTVFQQTKVRIVLRIKYYVPLTEKSPKQHTKINSNTINPAKKSPSKSNQIQSLFIEQYKEHLNDQDHYNKSLLLYQKSSQREHNYILFTCIVDYGVYPFSPPYLIVTENIGISPDLSLNNFSNITDEILHNSSWFPSFTIQDILKNIPDFVQNLKLNQTTFKSSYYYERTFRKLDIKQHALGLKIYEGESFDRKDTFFGKYLKKDIGVTLKSLIFFKNDHTNRLKICNIYPLNELEKLKINQTQKRIKFTLVFKGKLQISYKFTFQTDSNQNPQQIGFRNYFLDWMKLCLSKAVYENYNKTNLLSRENMTGKNQTFGHKSTKISNALNQNSMYNFSSGLEQRAMEESAQQKKKTLIERQEHLLGILETVDLLLCSSVYRPYENIHTIEQIEDIDQYGKQLSPERLNKKSNNEIGRKSIEAIRETAIDLTRNEFLKLKHFKLTIQQELKQIFNFF